jgi:F-type H+-transporting ATPase subunit delta
MNIGIISTRYARALYSLACEQGQEDVVYDEIKCMLQQFLTVHELKSHIVSPIVSRVQKTEILVLCAGGNNVSTLMRNFIEFVVKREKQDIIQFMCVAYKNVYRKAKNILSAKFVSAEKIDQSMLDKICALIENSYKGTVELETEINKNLIGGFILDVDNNRLDASVLGEINKLKAALWNK